ncbi:MAG TPA: pyruvate formate lyase-activating protein [Lachnospiraceae bacterium]|nr:pyruvate formate lyase-activating protein [Lachnospiraceae bacterium]
MTGNIHSIITGSTVDGPGTRYVVFLKGCPLRCLYCHNPDTWDGRGGKEMTVAEIMADMKSYLPFMKRGGLTVSGGEPLVQIDFVTELFAAAKQLGVQTALDTTGYLFKKDVPEIYAKYEKLAEVTDLVLLDLKAIDPKMHEELTGVKQDTIIDFYKYLDEKNIPIWVRHVIVPGYTFDPELLAKSGRFLAHFKNVKAVDILPYHDMAKPKYKEMGIDYVLKDVKPLTGEDGHSARDMVVNAMREERLRMKEAGIHVGYPFDTPVLPE